MPQPINLTLHEVMRHWIYLGPDFKESETAADGGSKKYRKNFVSNN